MDDAPTTKPPTEETPAAKIAEKVRAKTEDKAEEAAREDAREALAAEKDSAPDRDQGPPAPSPAEAAALEQMQRAQAQEQELVRQEYEATSQLHAFLAQTNMRLVADLESEPVGDPLTGFTVRNKGWRLESRQRPPRRTP